MAGKESARYIQVEMEEHDHSHGMGRFDEMRKRGTRAICIALVISIVFMFTQLIGGWIAGSLALLADAAHMFTDVVSFLLALFAFWISRRPASPRMSYGYYRAEIIGAMASSLALWIICAFLIYEAIRRIADPPPVRGGIVLIIACITLVMNLVTMRVLHGSKKESMNVKAAYLHVISDLLGNIGVILAGGIIYFTGWYLADPILTLLFTGLILFSSLRVIREGIEVLMEAAPRAIDTADVHTNLLLIPGVEDVHDLHIWTVASGRLALSAHLIGSDSQAILNQAHELLSHQYGITHTTLQIEHPDVFESQYCYDCNSS